MHPDLANLEQFYLRTRAEVTAGRLSGNDGLARVQQNTVTDAQGRRWAVDPRSPVDRAAFVIVDATGAAYPADPMQYQPAGGGMPADPFSQPGFGAQPFSQPGFGAQPNLAEQPYADPYATGPSYAGMPAYDDQSYLPTEEKKSRFGRDRFRRDKSSMAVSPSGKLDALKNLPRWAWIAAAGGFVLLLAVFKMLSGGPAATVTPSSLATTIPLETTMPTSPSDTTLPPTSSLPGDTTLPGTVTTLPGTGTTLPGTATTLPGTGTTVPGASATLTSARVSEVLTAISQGDISAAQAVVSSAVDPAAYQAFMAKLQSGISLTAGGEPTSLTPQMATAPVIKSTANPVGTEQFSVLFVKDASGSWKLRDLPAL